LEWSIERMVEITIKIDLGEARAATVESRSAPIPAVVGPDPMPIEQVIGEGGAISIGPHVPPVPLMEEAIDTSMPQGEPPQPDQEAQAEPAGPKPSSIEELQKSIDQPPPLSEEMTPGEPVEKADEPQPGPEPVKKSRPARR
jgi:hypothetical protein